jgi:hypothetical protein
MSGGGYMHYLGGTADPNIPPSRPSACLCAQLKALAKRLKDLAKHWHDLAEESRMLAELYLHFGINPKPYSISPEDALRYLAWAAREFTKAAMYDNVAIQLYIAAASVRVLVRSAGCA